MPEALFRSGASLVRDALRWPLRLIPPNQPVRVLRGPLRGYRWVAGAATHGCWLGTYEYEWQRRFALAAREVNVVFDVGAHAGYYTLIAAVSVGRNGRVIALEPAAVNLARLAEHLTLNDLENVTVMPVAAADYSGVGTFDAGVNSFEGHLSEAAGCTVTVVTIDSITGAGLPDPGLLKIDVEGAELRVLNGAAQTIARSRPVIFLATHSDALKTACVEWLSSAGYSVDTVRGSDLIAHPVTAAVRRHQASW